jgi:hypothetical protein
VVRKRLHPRTLEPEEEVREVMDAEEMGTDKCGECGSDDLLWEPATRNKLLVETATCQRCGQTTVPGPEFTPPFQKEVFEGAGPVSFDVPSSYSPPRGTSRRQRPPALGPEHLQAVRRIPKAPPKPRFEEPLPPLE